MKALSAMPVTYAPTDKVRNDSYRCTSSLAREMSNTWDMSSPERMSNLQGPEEHDDNIQMAMSNLQGPEEHDDNIQMTMSNLQGPEEHDNIQMATVDQKVLNCQRRRNIIVLGIVLTNVNYGLYIGWAMSTY